MPSPDVLRLDALTKRYGAHLPPAVNQVSLALGAGEMLALLGPSGCGKTTLLRLIAGFEKPDSGRLYLGNQAIDGGTWLPPERRDVGIVFQDYALFPHLTVEKNVAFGLQDGSGKGKPGQVQEQVEAAIALVGLQGLQRRYPHELSGGQQQRVALARALAPRPAIILLDEPFSNLDVQVRLYLRQEVRKILRQVGTASIFVTHDQEEALALADRVAVMHQGQVEQIDTPERIYGQPASRFVAEFVTQANFLPAHRRAQGWQTAAGWFETTADLAGADRADVMVRREDLTLTPDPQGPVTVSDRQFLGREYQYCLEAPGQPPIYARLPVDRPVEVGCRVSLGVPPQRVGLYSPKDSPAIAAAAFS